MKRQDKIGKDLSELLEELKIDQQRIKEKIIKLESTIAKTQAKTQRKIQEGDKVTIDNPKNRQKYEGIVVRHTNTSLLRVKTASRKKNVIRAEKNLTPK